MRSMRSTLEVTVAKATRGTSGSAGDYRPILMGDQCSYCGAPDNETVDHIQSRDRGGTNHWWNLTAACNRCNVRKRNSSLIGYIGWNADNAELGPMRDYITHRLRSWREV